MRAYNSGKEKFDQDSPPQGRSMDLMRIGTKENGEDREVKFPTPGNPLLYQRIRVVSRMDGRELKSVEEGRKEEDFVNVRGHHSHSHPVVSSAPLGFDGFF